MMTDGSTGKRTALYVRVSTEEQASANQEADLRQWAKRLGLKVVKTYRDDGISGAKADRPGLTAMLDAAHRREFDVLLIWALDRLSREGIRPVLGYLKKLQEAGVGVKSLNESWLNTGDAQVGELLVSVFSWVAQQERLRLGERTKAGLRKAKAEGTRSGLPIGRPPLPAQTVEQIKAALKQGTGIRATARLCDVGHTSVLRVKASMRPRRAKARRRYRRRGHRKEAHA